MDIEPIQALSPFLKSHTDEVVLKVDSKAAGFMAMSECYGLSLVRAFYYACISLRSAEFVITASV